MKILMISTEAAPFIQISDVAEAVTGLSIELKRKGHDVRVILPYYKSCEIDEQIETIIPDMTVPMGIFDQTATIYKFSYTADPSITIPVYLIQSAYYFGRENPYGYFDDDERFIFFTRGILEMLRHEQFINEDWQPDILHGHDWIAGFIPFWLRLPFYSKHNFTFVYTLHNTEIQGQGGYYALYLAELENMGIYSDLGETPQMINFMARGILAAHGVNTVSPTYAEELKRGEYSSNLENVIKNLPYPLKGILNGIDYRLYDPAFDEFLPWTFNQNRLHERKKNKVALQEICKLRPDDNMPLIGLTGDLVEETGIKLLEKALTQLLNEDTAFQLIISGPVNKLEYQDIFLKLKDSHPEQVYVTFSQDDFSSRLLYAGTDIMLFPCLYESCALHLLIAIHYGAVPLVRKIGSFADTVDSWQEKNNSKGRGFVFNNCDVKEFKNTFLSAVRLYKEKPAVWEEIQRHNISADFSWTKPADAYESFYQNAMEERNKNLILEKGQVIEPDKNDLLVNALVKANQLEAGIDKKTYLMQIAGIARFLLKNDAILIWLKDEEKPDLLFLTAYSLDVPVSEENSIYIKSSDHPWIRQNIYKKQSSTDDLHSQLGYLDSELALKYNWQNQLSVPLYISTTIIGRIDAFSCSAEESFNDWDMKALGSLANIIAVTLDHRKRDAQNKTFLEYAAELAKVQTETDFVQNLLDAIKQLVHVETCGIHIMDSNYYMLDEDMKAAEISASEFDSIGTIEKTGANTSCYCYPLVSEGEEIAQIKLIKTGFSGFSHEDYTLLNQIKSQFTPFLQLILKQKKQEQYRSGQLKMLTASLVGGGDINTLCNNIVKTTAEVLRVKAASLYLMEKDQKGKDILRIKAASGYDVPLLKVKAEYRPGEGSTGSIASKGEIIKANSLEKLKAKTAWKGKYDKLLEEKRQVFLGIPLKIQDDVIGVMKFTDRDKVDKVSSGQKMIFTDDDVRLAEMMANIITIVVSNAQSSKRQLTILGNNLKNLSIALSGGKEIKTLVDQIVRTMARVTGAEAAALYLIDESTNQLIIQAATGYQEPLVKSKASYDIGEGITGWIAKTGESFTANSKAEIEANPHWKGKHLKQQGNKKPDTLLGVPLKVVDRYSDTERIIGVLKIEEITSSPEHPEQRFTEQDVLLMDMMANVIATVVYNTQIANDQLERLGNNLEQLSAAMAGGREIKELVKRIVKTIFNVIGAGASSLYLIDETTNELEIQAAAGYQDELVEKGASYKIGEGITGWIAEKGELFRANTLKELKNHPNWKGKQDSKQKGHQPNTFLGLPLKVVDRHTGNEKIIGVLKIEEIQKSPIHPDERFTEQDVLLVNMMANVIATVVYNTQYSHNELERLGNNLQALSSALTGGNELQILVTDVVETMAKVMGAEASSLYLIDNATNKLVIQAAAGYQEVLVEKGASYKIGEGITGWIAETGKLFRANTRKDLMKHPSWKGKMDNMYDGRQPNSFLGLPLKVKERRIEIEKGTEKNIIDEKEKILGVLKIENIKSSPKHPENFFTDQDILLNTMMANVIATVIHNTRESDIQMGKILQRMGMLSTTKNPSVELLTAFSRSKNPSSIEQIAIAIANSLDQQPDQALEEIKALFDVQANLEIYNRISCWLKNKDAKWLFSLFYNILSVKKGFKDNWKALYDFALPLITMRKNPGIDAVFEGNINRIASHMADIINVQILQTCFNLNWGCVIIETENIFGAKIKTLPLIFKRKDQISADDREQLLVFINTELKKPYHVVLLISWYAEIDEETIRQMKEYFKPYAIELAAVYIKDFLSLMLTANSAAALHYLVIKQIKTISPFVIVGAVPDAMFFGRAQEIKEILMYITTNNSCALIGGRRIGKTSILRRLHRVALPEQNYRSFYFDLGKIPVADQKQYNTLFTDFKITDWKPDQPENPPENFTQLLNNPPVDKPLVLLFDEADRLIAPDKACNWKFFNQLRALINSESARIILCGESVLRELLENASSPLYNFANKITLGCLSRDAVEQLVRESFEKLEILLSNEEEILNKIWNATSGHPNVVQRLCRRLIDRMNEKDIGRRITGDVDSVTSNPDFIREDLLTTFFARATVLEHLCILFMSKNKDCLTLRKIHKALSEYKIDITLNQVDKALERLVDLRGILERSDDGYAFKIKAIPSVIAQSKRINDWIDLRKEIHINKGDIDPDLAPDNLGGELW